MPLTYGSVCSGIEAASVAWEPLGWRAAFLSEIEKFPSAVLAHHHPDVPNRGDMTKYKDWPDDAIDLLVGGTPCQSFSIAGLRQGLADPRGNLMLTYLAIARRYQPRWLVWENVPGVLSSANGRDFATFIRGLEELGYHAAWRVLDAQFVRVDGFGRAVPQRRRRVFVVGYLGDWRRAAAVLLEPEGMQGDSAPRRQAGQGIAPTISARPTGGGGLGTDFDLDGGLLAFGAQNSSSQGDSVSAHISPSLDKSKIPGVALPYTLAIRGRDGVPDLEYRQDGTANAILTPNGGRAGIGVGAIAFVQNSRDEVRLFGGDGSTVGALAAEPGMKQQSYVAHAIQAGALRENPASGPDGIGVQEGIAYTLEARAEQQAVAWSIMPQNSGKDYKARAVDVAQPVMAGGPVGGNQGGDYIQQAWAVRRLTPTECERLQGFPDGYTDIPWRGKTNAPDGPRYKALGNSMAVNVMRWIGRRIEMVEKLSSEIASRKAA